MLNKRITNWADDNEMTGEEQAGFMQERSTSDHIFTLLALVQNSCWGAESCMWLAPDLIELLILLFADDVVLLSDSVIGLQTQLNVLFNTAKRLDLIVNLNKSNIVVFRNRGHLT